MGNFFPSRVTGQRPSGTGGPAKHRHRFIIWLCLILAVQCVLAAAISARNRTLLTESLDQALQVEKKRLAEIKKQRVQFFLGQQDFQSDMLEYSLQLSAHRNVLILPGYDTYEIKKAGLRHQATLNRICGREEEMAETVGHAERRLKAMDERRRAYKAEKVELQSRHRSFAGEKQLLKQLGQIHEILDQQEKLLTDTLDICHHRLKRLQSFQKEFSLLAEKFEKKIAEKKNRRLLHRFPNPVSRLDPAEIKIELARLAEVMSALTRFYRWQSHNVPDSEEYGLFLLRFMLLLAALEICLAFYGRLLRRRRDACWEKGNFWQYLTLRLLRRTLLMLGALLFIHFYRIPPAYQVTPFFMLMGVAEKLLLVLLPIRWAINYIQIIHLKTESLFFCFPAGVLKILLYALIVFGCVYVPLGWGLGTNALIPTLLRLVMAAGLFVLSVFFWRGFLHLSRRHQEQRPAWCKVLRPVLPTLGYAVVLFGLICELLGYGRLSLFWFRAWAQTAAVLLWGGLLFMVLREADTAVATTLKEGAFYTKDTGDDEEAAEEEEEKSAPVKWLLIRLGKIGLLVGTVAALPLAWGGRESVLKDILDAVNYQVSLGKFHISVLDVIAAVLFLLIIHSAVAIWKSILKEKILAKRDLEPGLQDSIVTISGYLIWIIGFFIALRIVGISAASLTVLFGAVGIGLGFGLQNIFNNFVSGIILLFERPIKVGDVIEINGLWGTVKRINVRSTQVRTYDNADLIIPNADFVSRQLTNWSFKEPKLRRSVVARVA